MEKDQDWVRQAGKKYAVEGGQIVLLDETMEALFGRTEGTERDVLTDAFQKAFVSGALLRS